MESRDGIIFLVVIFHNSFYFCTQVGFGLRDRRLDFLAFGLGLGQPIIQILHAEL